MIAALRRTAFLGFVIACTLAATVAPAGATPGEPTTLHVQGNQTQVSENHYKSYGGLLGDFWILTFVPWYESDSLVIGTGTERFVGCGVTEPVGVLVGCRQFPSSTGPDGGPLDARCSPKPRLRTRGLLLPGARVEAALRGSPVSWMRKMAR